MIEELLAHPRSRYFIYRTHGSLKDVAMGEDAMKYQLPKKWLFLGSLAAIMAVFVAIEGSATKLFDGYQNLSKAAHIAIFGPDPVFAQLPAVNGEIADGGTSDRTKAYRKTSQICIRPSHANGSLFAARFVPTLRSSEDRATFTVVADTPNAYCVELMAATGAKERLEIIRGYLTASERYIPL